MTDIFHLSKLLIKKKLKILTDAEKFQLKKLNAKYPFSKEIKIDELVDRVESYSIINREKAWKSIEVKTQKKIKKPVFKLFNTSWYKYAATLIIVLTTVYFLKDVVFRESSINNSIIVNTKTIKPGSDKATLTLSDGSMLSLEKGTAIKTQNANSNGEKIIYQSSKGRTETIAYNYLTIPRGGQFFIELSDGTKVWLNSESQLKYPVAFIKGQTRKVELVYGEAYFDVTSNLQNSGAKFKVINQFQEIEVLGTEFNIKAYKDETNIYTTLVEGKVSVKTGNNRQKLIPNQQLNFSLNTNVLTLKEVDIYNEISWKEGVFSFERKPLKEIMKVFSRWYDTEVIFENKDLEDVKFFGVLDKSQEIEEILKTIKKFKIIENYEIRDKVIVLK